MLRLEARRLPSGSWLVVSSDFSNVDCLSAREEVREGIGEFAVEVSVAAGADGGVESEGSIPLVCRVDACVAPVCP